MKDSDCCDEACSTDIAEILNSDCFCGGLDLAALTKALRSDPGTPDIAALISERCPHLFSPTPVFISAEQARRMQELIDAIETVIAMPSYRAHVLRDAPAAAQHGSGARGVFFGYDFHLDGDDIGLIEINTNAGGALLSAAQSLAQNACAGLAIEPAARFEQAIVAMFREEWRLAGHAAPLRTIAIVDADPEAQYLYPEFLLFRQLFQAHGIEAVIAAPEDVRWEQGRLWHAGLAIDLVYNRLTDFLLASPACAALHAAWLADAAVITPHPQAHALYADKRNLALLTDPARLAALGVPEATQRILLAGIPRTEVVRPADAGRLWEQRRTLFFKPTAGYGGRAAYRGDKLTKRVWQDILDGDYVAQALMAPAERITGSRASPEKRKFDIRCYCYDGKVQWTAARLYQGQTTNFRTPGGGFAVVYQV
ncbi:MAG: hypothetical protein V4631_18040 [Pseudomonadota bacterium]